MKKVLSFAGVVRARQTASAGALMVFETCATGSLMRSSCSSPTARERGTAADDPANFVGKGFLGARAAATWESSDDARLAYRDGLALLGLARPPLARAVGGDRVDGAAELVAGSGEDRRHVGVVGAPQ